jgi:hypothetical protein
METEGGILFIKTIVKTEVERDPFKTFGEGGITQSYVRNIKENHNII